MCKGIYCIHCIIGYSYYRIINKRIIKILSLIKCLLYINCVCKVWPFVSNFKNHCWFCFSIFFCRYNQYRRFFRVRNVVSHRVILCEYMQTLLYNITRLISCSFWRSASISFMSDSLYLLRPNDLIHFLYHFIRRHYSFSLKVCVWYCLPQCWTYQYQKNCHS